MRHPLKTILILFLVLVTPLAIVGVSLAVMVVKSASFNADTTDIWPHDACAIAESFVETYVELKEIVNVLAYADAGEILDEKMSSPSRTAAIQELMMLTAGLKLDASKVVVQSANDCPNVVVPQR